MIIIKLLAIAIFLCHLSGLSYGSHCYPEFCRNSTIFGTESFVECLLTPVQRGDACTKLNFENLPHQPPDKKAFGKFQLKAYVKDFGEFSGKVTAFNLSFSDVQFKQLTTRYQSMTTEDASACRQINVNKNATRTAPIEIFVSCPFADESFEGTSYRFEYLVVGDNFEYTRKIVFTVPRHNFIEQTTDVRAYTPFVYIDVSSTTTLTLYAQHPPKNLNITSYKVWLFNNETNDAKVREIALSDVNELSELNLEVKDGLYYFTVAANHPSCGQYGCANITSPFIRIKQTSNRLLIMIISIVWIPPVIFYAFYQAYRLYRKKELLKVTEKKPNCILVYSPSTSEHVNVMTDLAKYLRYCNINAMIDVLDIPNTANKDPGLWCNTAFYNADVVIVATSPPASNYKVTSIYRNVDNHALRLIKENYPKRNKRYLAVQLPYCKTTDIPEEAKYFKRYNIPDDLDKLVRSVHNVEFVRFFGISNNELVHSVNLAKLQTSPSDTEECKITKETDELLLPMTVVDSLNHVNNEKRDELNYQSTLNEGVTQTNYSTNIDELDLLGESDGIERQNYVSPLPSSEFRIDKLNL